MIKKLILLGITAALLITLLTIGPIPQDTEYHAFADSREFFGTPNLLNVLTNFLFILIGIWGLALVRSGKIVLSLLYHYIIFCTGIFLIGFASAYYHLSPDNSSLVWDRLPMTIAFMSFFSALIAEYISLRWGKKMLVPTLILGIASVLYWKITEAFGAGDLRPYAAVQYIPLVLASLLLLMYEPENTYKKYVFWSLVFYGLAKAAELSDVHIFIITRNFISGHSLKHIFAAVGSIFAVKMFISPKKV